MVERTAGPNQSPSPSLRQIGGFSSLIQALEHASRFEERGFQFFDGLAKHSVQLGYRELLERSRTLAAHLTRHLGLRKGAHIGLLAETGPDFIVHFCACQMAGLVPCPLPLPGTLQGRERYEQTLKAMIDAAGIRLLAGPQKLLSQLQLQDGETGQWFYENASVDGPIDTTEWHMPEPEEIAYVQFSSGSTADPKGMAISHRALMANVDDILHHGMRLEESDRALSWLPFYHDMGLVGMLLAPLCGQVCMDYMAPSAFVRRPHLWPELMARQGTTITYAPPFAYALAAERAQLPESPYSLGALRIAGVGGDSIDMAQLRAFAQCYAGSGFDPDAFKPSYGLAEATLAVSMCNAPFDALAQAFFIDEVTGLVQRADADAQPAPQMAQRELVSCGQALPGWRIAVEDAAGAALPPMRIGRIVVSGAARMSGFMQQGLLHADTAQGLDTGDTGFMTEDGELFIAGRNKDMLIVRGRNLWPQDVERLAASQFDCDVDDLMLLQTNDVNAPLLLLMHARLASRVDQAAMHAFLVRAFGIALELQLVPNGFMERTSSGKKARGNTRRKYLSDSLATHSS